MTERLCLSKIPECSGLLPCEVCHKRAIVEVISPAIVASTTRILADSLAPIMFQAGLNDPEVAPRFLSLVKQKITEISNAAGEAFFQTYGEAWQTMVARAAAELAPTLNGALPSDPLATVHCSGCGKEMSNWEGTGNPCCSIECAHKIAAQDRELAASAQALLEPAPGDEEILVTKKPAKKPAAKKKISGPKANGASSELSVPKTGEETP